MPGKFDATPYARKVISAVILLNESSGIDYIIDVLTGSHSENIINEHRQSEIFGSGKSIHRQDWLNLIRDLISLGYLKRSTANNGVLVISEKGKRVIEGHEQVVLFQSPFRKNEKVPTASGKKALPDFEPDLLQLLKETRKYLASSKEVEVDDVIPYLKLHQLATYLPDNKDNFQKISGYNDTQMKSYGNTFLKVIIEYLEVNSLRSRMNFKRTS